MPAPAELIAVPDAVPAGQDDVQVIVDTKAAAAEPVRVAGGRRGDEPGCKGRLGAAVVPQPPA